MDKKMTLAMVLLLLAIMLASISWIYRPKRNQPAGSLGTPTSEQQPASQPMDNAQATRESLERTAAEIAASTTMQKELEQNKLETKKASDAMAKTIAASSTLQEEMNKNVEATRKALQAFQNNNQ